MLLYLFNLLLLLVLDCLADLLHILERPVGQFLGLIFRVQRVRPDVLMRFASLHGFDHLASLHQAELQISGLGEV